MYRTFQTSRIELIIPLFGPKERSLDHEDPSPLDPPLCLETGTVVRCWSSHNNDTCLDVWWDCGTKKIYSQKKGEWKNIRVLDMGPAGEVIQMLIAVKAWNNFMDSRS